MKFKMFIMVLLAAGTLFGQNRLENVNKTTVTSNSSVNSFTDLVEEDYSRFYSTKTIGDSTFFLLVGAMIANTEADDNFNGWYQNDFRSERTDEFSRFAKQFGEGEDIVPIMAGAWLLGHGLDKINIAGADHLEEWGEKSIRTLVVGAPVLLVTQIATGAGRPEEGGSEWEPFDDNNGVSGHAFMGAVPFLTAAQMTDNTYLKGMYFFGSTWCAWSLVNDNDHYLSQAVLGWSLAYVSSLSVFDKESFVHFSPIVTNRGAVGLRCEFNF